VAAVDLHRPPTKPAHQKRFTSKAGLGLPTKRFATSWHRRRCSIWLLNQQGDWTVSSIVFCPFVHPFDSLGSTFPVRVRISVAKSTLTPFPEKPTGLEEGSRAAVMRPVAEQDARRRSLQPTVKERALAWWPNLEGPGFHRGAFPNLEMPAEWDDTQAEKRQVTFRSGLNSSGERLTPQPRLRQASSIHHGSPLGRDIR
jgi:hypothetical protein